MAESDRLRLLLVDDQPQDRALARLVLSSELPGARVEEVAGATAFAAAIRSSRFDLVVTEIQLSWSDGLAVLATVRETAPGIPVIAFTEVRDEELVVEGMKAGFADVVFKGSRGYLQLATAVRRAREQARHRLLVARSESWLRTLLDRADVGVYRSTLDGRLIESTPALLRLLGVRSLEEALEIRLPEPYFVSEEREELLQRLGSDRALRSRETEFVRADGSSLWLGITEVLLLDVDDEIVVDVLVQDISRFKRQQEEARRRLQELERSNADLSQFAYIASHELQEPLRMVEKFGALLAESHGKKLGVEGGELLQSMIEGSRRMQNLIDDLLALSRIDTDGAEFRDVDCNEILEEALLNLSDAVEESAAEIEWQTLPTVRGDASQLVQLFQNLISNAIKFRRGESLEIVIAVTESEQDWVISVDDNGVGIDPDELEEIFEIFRRLHPELPGTGIGLTICRRIAERHGGRIWAESKGEPGARFLFSLPKREEEMKGPEPLGSEG